jgi:hypothetical protein
METKIMRKRISKCNDIPHAHAPGALAVTDGGTCIGRIVVRDGSYFAFETDNVLVGEFATQREAMRALPAAKASSSMIDEVLRGYCDAQSRILTARSGGIAPGATPASSPNRGDSRE